MPSRSSLHTALNSGRPSPMNGSVFSSRHRRTILCEESLAFLEGQFSHVLPHTRPIRIEERTCKGGPAYQKYRQKKVRLHGLAAICRSTPYPCPPLFQVIPLKRCSTMKRPTSSPIITPIPHDKTQQSERQRVQ